MESAERYKLLATSLRALAIDMVEQAQSGHPGMPMGMADVIAVLYADHMRFNPKDPKWLNRDRLVLSAGHGSALLYALLHLCGYEDATLDELKAFRQLGSRTPGHPEYGHLSGVEVTTGPLGQGIGNAVGMALAGKMLARDYGSAEASNYKAYCVVGDGCLMEGISQEAISFAGRHALDNLVVLFDDNGVTIDGKTRLSTFENHVMRFKACGWNVVGKIDNVVGIHEGSMSSIDGHNYFEISQALEQARAIKGPVMIPCKTIIGFGAPDVAGTSKVHGAPLGEQLAAAAKKNYGIDWEPFEIPQYVYQIWQDIAIRNKGLYTNWQERFANKVKSADISNLDLSQLKAACIKQPVTEATRKSSERVLTEICKQVPRMAGGSADLTSSNNTKTTDQSVFDKDGAGKGPWYIYYGIREHAMAAIMNGLALDGQYHVYGGTFLTFSDYMRPAMRLSALMHLPVIYVCTHDSIGLGEDGPTHQPVEHLSSLRAMPNMQVFRPCDVIETAEAYEVAMKSTQTPSVLALSRQNLPQLRQSCEENLAAKGAYPIWQSNSAEYDYVLFASGSEVHLAIEVAKKLSSAIVYSVPCMDRVEYKSLLASLPANNHKRVVIEAGVRQSWEWLLRSGDMFFGVETFGMSGKAKDVFEHFGLTIDNICSKLQDVH
jgi:transketolase